MLAIRQPHGAKATQATRYEAVRGYCRSEGELAQNIGPPDQTLEYLGRYDVSRQIAVHSKVVLRALEYISQTQHRSTCRT